MTRDEKHESGQDARELTQVCAHGLRWKRLVKLQHFECRVKLARREGKKRRIS